MPGLQVLPVETTRHTDNYSAKQLLAAGFAVLELPLAEQWRPWRSYAVLCLWNSLAA